jgi:hypothetical protein
MPDRSLTCRECGKQVANTHNVLARHVRSAHAMEWAEYVVRHEHGGVWPTCACGCGQRLMWKKGGFGKYTKGHDGHTTHDASRMDWVLNPFTGREEHITGDDERALFEHCVLHADAVTHDHSIRVPWQDATDRIRLDVPAFKHLRKKLLMVVDRTADPDAGRRRAGYKRWCDEHSYAVIFLRRVGDGFEVHGGHVPEGFEGGA